MSYTFHTHTPSLSLYLSISRTHTHTHSLSLYIYISVCLSVCLSVYLSLSIYLSLYITLSLPVHLCPSLSLLSLSCLSPSQSPSSPLTFSFSAPLISSPSVYLFSIPFIIPRIKLCQEMKQMMQNAWRMLQVAPPRLPYQYPRYSMIKKALMKAYV